MARLWGKEWTRPELLERVGRIDQLAGIRASEGLDGKSRGARTLDVYTGSGLTFRVLPDRGLDVGACSFQGAPLAWISTVGEAHPAYFEAGGNGWLRNFGGGLVSTCGLDQFGAAGPDGAEAFGLHGRVANQPAEELAYGGRWDGDSYVLSMSGVIRQGRVFGEALVLRRTMRTSLGSNRIELTDEVTNEGFEPQPHMLLYHCNLGFPLIDEGTHLQVPARATTPRDPAAEAGLAAWSHMEAPRAGFQEQVFEHTLRATERGDQEAEPAVEDANAAVVVGVDGPRSGLRLDLTIDTTTLPILYQWKMTGQGSYVLGLEPANCRGIGGRGEARRDGILPMLEPQECRRYRLAFEVSRIGDAMYPGAWLEPP